MSLWTRPLPKAQAQHPWVSTVRRSTNGSLGSICLFCIGGCVPANLFQEAVHGWLLGSQAFIDRIRRLMKEPKHPDEVPSARRLANLPVETVIGAVAEYYGTTPAAFACRRSVAPGRDIAAWLARRLTSATLRELAAPFGLGHPDSVSNLVRRANEAVDQSKRLQRDVASIRNRLAKTENRV